LGVVEWGYGSLLRSVARHFEVLKDPCAQHRIEHLLIDIVVITICAVICGAESWPEIEKYDLAKQVWLKTLLELAMERDWGGVEVGKQDVCIDELL
jgi:DDE_Tnp_1-associated